MSLEEFMNHLEIITKHEDDDEVLNSLSILKEDKENSVLKSRKRIEDFFNRSDQEEMEDTKEIKEEDDPEEKKEIRTYESLFEEV